MYRVLRRVSVSDARKLTKNARTNTKQEGRSRRGKYKAPVLSRKHFITKYPISKMSEAPYVFVQCDANGCEKSDGLKICELRRE